MRTRMCTAFAGYYTRRSFPPDTKEHARAATVPEAHPAPQGPLKLQVRASGFCVSRGSGLYPSVWVVVSKSSFCGEEVSRDRTTCDVLITVTFLV